jgi:hypothetical protein
VKFHLIASVPSSPGASFFGVLKKRVGVRAVDLDLGEQRKADVVGLFAELLDFGVVARLLMAELIARGPEHLKTPRAEPPMQNLATLTMSSA